MNLHNINITKLPPDAKKEFIKYAIKLTQKREQSTLSKDFLSFVKAMWPQFIEGPHHKIIAQKFNDIADGKIKRLLLICHLGILNLNLRLISSPRGW